MTEQKGWRDEELQQTRAAGQAFISSQGLDRPSTVRSLWFVATTLVTFASPPVLYAALPIWIGLPVGLLVSLRALSCLSQVSHMSVHGTLLRHRRLGDLLGDLCAYGIGYTLYIRKQTHLEHHRALNTVEDPDATWGLPDQTPSELVRGLVRDLLGFSVVPKALQYYRVERQRFTRAFEFRGALKFLGGVATMQFLLLLWYGVTGGLLAYGLLFLWPVATMYPATIRLRSFAEHSLEDGHTGWMSRTVRPSLLERFVMAPGYQFLHFEHHLFPALPLYHLPRLHKVLLKTGFVVAPQHGYVGYLLHRF